MAISNIHAIPCVSVLMTVYNAEAYVRDSTWTFYSSFCSLEKWSNASILGS